MVRRHPSLAALGATGMKSKKCLDFATDLPNTSEDCLERNKKYEEKTFKYNGNLLKIIINYIYIDYFNIIVRK